MAAPLRENPNDHFHTRTLSSIADTRPILERQPQSKLDLARSGDCVYDPAGGTVAPGCAGERSSGNLAEVGTVEQIEELRTELQIGPFAYSEGLAQR